MNDYIILTDSSVDYTPELAEELDVHILPLAYLMDGKTYLNHPDHRDMPIEELYARLRAGTVVTTNAVNLSQFVEAAEPFLKAGTDVLIISFSSGLSSTYASAKMAAEELSEAYPQRKICAVDTLAASLGQGLLVWYAAKKRLAGASFEEVRDWVEENKLHMCHWFTVDDLHFLKRGGRISAATAVVGSLLSIKPVLHMDDEGHLVSVSKARGRKASLVAMADKVGELAIEPEKQTMFISHGDCLEEARFLADLVKERYGVKEIFINFVGPVIGAHSGPGTIALFFLGVHR